MKYLVEKMKTKEDKYDLLVLETCLVENGDSTLERKTHN